MLRIERDGAVKTLTLDRPTVRNALDDQLIADLHDECVALSFDREVRVVILRGAGPAFCSGVDLISMDRAALMTADENRADATRFCEMLLAFDQLPQATICVVHGAAMAGALGLVGAADIAVAADTAIFSLSEVRLGLVPAVVAPFVIRAIGTRQARRWFLTGERFGAAKAHAMGLVHEVAPDRLLASTVDGIVANLLRGGPRAIAEAKRVVDLVATNPQGGSFVAGATVQASARQRVSVEGREGLAAYLGKRRPDWCPPDP